MKSLADAVRVKRGDQSIRNLAALLDEPFTIIAAVERGRIPQPRSFVKIMNWLGVLPRRYVKAMLPYTNERRDS